jgi:UDP-N-acetylglucosamine transferase subunit ALG13
VIFVTVGNATQGFMRLLESVERLARSGALAQEEIFMQTGNNLSFHSDRCQHQSFITMEEFQRRLTSADVIISHGGCTVFQVLRLGKVPVVMPRVRRYREHINDHQLDFVKAMAQEKWVVPAYESEDLAQAIHEARNRPLQTWMPSRMPQLIGQAVHELLSEELV